MGFPPDQFLALNRLDWVQGSPESALPKLRSGRGILVAKEFLVAHGKQVGSTIRLGGGSISQEYEIVGVVGAAGLDVATQFFGIRSVYLQNAVSCVFMDFNEVATRFGSRDAYILQVDMDDTLGPEADKVLGDAVQQAIPGAVFASGRAIRRTVEEIGATVLSVTSTVAFGALLLACIGVGNVVAANISARRFEYGVLRATGASPGLLVRLVAAEVLLVAVAGGLAGTCLGLWLAHMGVMWHRLITGMELHPEMPLPPVLIGYGVLVLLTLAAAWPAVHALVRKPVRALLAH
ncbi:MAG: ABC transporter permease [Phycisphaerales bacterium]